MVNPNDVAGYDIDSAGFHFLEFLAPFGFGVARVVELAHCPHDPLSVDHETQTVCANGVFEDWIVGVLNWNCGSKLLSSG